MAITATILIQDINKPLTERIIGLLRDSISYPPKRTMKIFKGKMLILKGGEEDEEETVIVVRQAMEI